MSTQLRLDGLRVAIACNGSRGDCQPYVALALGLKKHGCVVTIVSNADHEKMVRDFGINHATMGVDFESFVTTDGGVREAMTTGSAMKFLRALGESFQELYPGTFERGWTALEHFKPDLILCSPLCGTLCNIYCHRYRVPVVRVPLQLVMLTGEVSPWGMNRCLPFACVNRGLWKVVFRAYVGTIAKQVGAAAAYLGSGDFVHALPASLDEAIEDMKDPIAPVLVGCSPAVASVPSDCKHPNITACGWWILDQEQQTQRSLAGDENFGGAQWSEIGAFLEAGAPPVYIGWGSMIAVSPEFMTRVAVSALREAGLRGVVLRGWAKLGPDLLDRQELIDYAKDWVLFVDSAPHEWLMPRCAVCVTHGGSGTTAASMRSGKPSVITPVFLDQLDFAASVARLGNGQATCQFQKLTVSVLAGKIKACLADASIQRRAAEVSSTLRAEDGVGVAVERIKAFVEGPVSSGAWLSSYTHRLDRRRAARAASQSRTSCFCFGPCTPRRPSSRAP